MYGITGECKRAPTPEGVAKSHQLESVSFSYDEQLGNIVTIKSHGLIGQAFGPTLETAISGALEYLYYAKN